MTEISYHTHSQNSPNRRAITDLVGQTFGRLTVNAYAGIQNHKSRWHCLCKCGNEVLSVRASSLLNGHTQSCGCLHKRDRKTTPPRPPAKQRAYNAWANMLTRCRNPHNPAFKNYGGRGITVCQRWEQFSAFYEDMGDCPPNKSIDRINNNGNYTPDNCRWTTKENQSRNKRTSHFLTYNGKTQHIIEWAEEFQIPYARIRERIKRGLTPQDCLSLKTRR